MEGVRVQGRRSEEGREWELESWVVREAEVELGLVVWGLGLGRTGEGEETGADGEPSLGWVSPLRGSARPPADRLSSAVEWLGGSLAGVGGVSRSDWLPAAGARLLSAVSSARRDGCSGGAPTGDGGRPGDSDGGGGGWSWRRKGRRRPRSRRAESLRTRRSSRRSWPSRPSAAADAQCQRPAARPTTEQTTAAARPHHASPLPTAPIVHRPAGSDILSLGLTSPSMKRIIRMELFVKFVFMARVLNGLQMMSLWLSLW